jgi:hypothetical protein
MKKVYEVQVQAFFAGWANAFAEESNPPPTFPSKKEAQQFLDDFLNDCRASGEFGYTQATYRVQKVSNQLTYSKGDIMTKQHILKEFKALSEIGYRVPKLAYTILETEDLSQYDDMGISEIADLLIQLANAR